MSVRRSIADVSSLAVFLVACSGAAKAQDVVRNGGQTAQSAPPNTGPRLQATVSGHGPAVAILGGGLLGVEGFEPYVQDLSSDHTVVLLQQLAVQYGLEDRSLGPDYSIGMESAAMTRALDALGLGGAVDVIGHSSGALIALDFAIHHPKRVRTLTLSEPPTYFLLDNAQKEAPEIRAWTEMLRSQPAEGDVSEVQLESFLHGVGAISMTKSGKDLPMWPEWVKHRRSLRARDSVVRLNEPPGSLRAFSRPVLLLRGDDTTAPHVMFNARLEQEFSRATLVDLPGGHLAILASRDRFLPTLHEFLASAP